jgi:hypothetical protein
LNFELLFLKGVYNSIALQPQIYLLPMAWNVARSKGAAMLILLRVQLSNEKSAKVPRSPFSKAQESALADL